MRFRVTRSAQKERLDLYLVKRLPQLNRSIIKKLTDLNRIRINKATAKAGYKLRNGDNIDVDFDPDELNKTPMLDIPVLYEDDDCMVINKPEGILTHSKGAFNPEATVASFIKDRVIDIEGDRAGIVHRLDRATSGVMIVAKNSASLIWLQKQFSKRLVEKEYVAIIRSGLKPEKAEIRVPLERNPKIPQTFRASRTGKEAITLYDVSQQNEKYSQVKLKPLTGRTHQLRVHLAYLGYPVVGDVLYRGETADRLYLHAHSLELKIPDGTRKVFKVPIPNEFKNKLGK